MKLFLVFTFALLCSLNKSFAQSNQNQEVIMYELLKGTFIIKERPKDFKVNFVWVNTPFKNSSLGENLIYHKRILSHAPERPLVQLIMQIKKDADSVAIQYYAMKKNIEEKLSASNELEQDLMTLSNDDLVILSDQTIRFVYENNAFFGKAEYSTVFRGSDYGKIEMILKDDTIYNWTRYFKNNGTLVYGPKEKGYLLKKSN